MKGVTRSFWSVADMTEMILWHTPSRYPGKHCVRSRKQVIYAHMCPWPERSLRSHALCGRCQTVFQQGLMGLQRESIRNHPYAGGAGHRFLPERHTWYTVGVQHLAKLPEALRQKRGEVKAVDFLSTSFSLLKLAAILLLNVAYRPLYYLLSIAARYRGI